MPRNGETIRSLKAGKIYEFRHLRKGTFRAKLVDVINADEGDEADAELLLVEIDTSLGSGQERLANAVELDPETGGKRPASLTEKLIRPSLITAIDEVKGG